MKVIHIIPSLVSGGAETMLYKLLKNKSTTNYEVEIVTLTSGDYYTDKIKEMNIPIHELNLKANNPLKSIVKLIKILKTADIIQSWMYYSDFLSFFIGKLILRKKVIWGVRRSYLNKELMKSTTFYIAKLNSYLSKFVDKVVSCSIVGKDNHVEFGYSAKNMVVIANGFDINELDESDFIRLEMNLTANTNILLNVARWELLKDHKTLLKAVNILKIQGIKFNLVLVGKNIDKHNVELNEEIRLNNVEDCVTLLGERKDIPYLMKAADFYISSSISEGFPNVIGEAMASSLYCIATDAGDTKYILGETGSVVESGNPEMLANGIIQATRLEHIEKQRLVSLALSRVKTEFSIGKIVSEYEKLYRNLMR